MRGLVVVALALFLEAAFLLHVALPEARAGAEATLEQARAVRYPGEARGVPCVAQARKKC